MLFTFSERSCKSRLLTSPILPYNSTPRSRSSSVSPTGMLSTAINASASSASAGGGGVSDFVGGGLIPAVSPAAGVVISGVLAVSQAWSGASVITAPLYDAMMILSIVSVVLWFSAAIVDDRLAKAEQRLFEEEEEARIDAAADESTAAAPKAQLSAPAAPRPFSPLRSQRADSPKSRTGSASGSRRLEPGTATPGADDTAGPPPPKSLTPPPEAHDAEALMAVDSMPVGDTDDDVDLGVDL